jgi:hypothetical protein
MESQQLGTIPPQLAEFWTLSFNINRLREAGGAQIRNFSLLPFARRRLTQAI